MNLTSPKNIKEIFEKHGAKANKTLGQNFLIDRNILNKIISAGGIKKTDTILEIGPGIGTLTQELAKRAGKVVAIEKDPIMCGILKETLLDCKNAEVIQEDILKILDDFKLISNFKFQISNYKVVANIPYYLTSPLIRKFLEHETPPEFLVLMVQKEVAKRICSTPPSMSLLAVSVQFYAKPEIIANVSKNCFMPAPKVDSAIIKIIPFATNKKTQEFSELFFQIVKAGFSHPRKQLLGNLSSGLKLPKKATEEWLFKNNIKANQRAETLSVEDWRNLTKTFEEIHNK